MVTLHDSAGQYICATQRVGSEAGIALDYREIIELALANRASGMLLVHNHPSGDPRPSDADIAATRALIALCRPLKIFLHDHLVIGAATITSMRRACLLDNERRVAA